MQSQVAEVAQENAIFTERSDLPRLSTYMMQSFSANDAKWLASYQALLEALRVFVAAHHPAGLTWGNTASVLLVFTPAHRHQIRSMTFWSNVLAKTAPGEGKADEYIYNYKLGVPLIHGSPSACTGPVRAPHIQIVALPYCSHSIPEGKKPEE